MIKKPGADLFDCGDYRDGGVDDDREGEEETKDEEEEVVGRVRGLCPGGGTAIVTQQVRNTRINYFNVTAILIVC